MLALNVFAQQIAADTAPKVLLALAVLALVFGIGVVFVGRRSVKKPSSAQTLTKQATESPVAVASARDRLSKVRSSFAGAITTALTRSAITQETWDELEEALLRADVGVATTNRVLAPLRELVKSKQIVEPSDLSAALRNEMTRQLSTSSRQLNFDTTLNAPNIWLVVGVNGAGKTTTIGKLSAQQHALGRTVLMAAGDTFRAAAGDQLDTWAQRSGAEIVRGAAGGAIAA